MSTQFRSTRLAAAARHFVRAVADQAHAELARRGYGDLRPVHHHVFAHVHDGGRRITEIAERTGLSKAAIVLIVDELEAGGYVTRTPDPSDGRAKVVRLTRRGKAAARASIEVADELDRRWADVIGADRVDDVKSALIELTTSARAASTLAPWT